MAFSPELLSPKQVAVNSMCAQSMKTRAGLSIPFLAHWTISIRTRWMWCTWSHRKGEHSPDFPTDDQLTLSAGRSQKLMIHNTLFKEWNEQEVCKCTSKEVNEYWYMPAAFLLWPLTSNRFLFSDRSCTAFPAPSCTYTFSLREKRKKRKDFGLVKTKKNNNFIWPRMRGKKYATRSRTIFPLTHGPVQVVCSPQSIIFTAATDGRKADCNYSYRYWGHLEVVSPGKQNYSFLIKVKFSLQGAQ